MKKYWLIISISLAALAAISSPALLAQSLSGESEEVLLIPSGQTEAGPIAIFVDNDVDGIADEFETTHGLDPANPLDALEDPDVDDLTNLLEFKNGTNPRNPDTDGDGTSDGSEVLLGTDPLDPAIGGAAVTLEALQLIPSFTALTLNSFPALSQATLQLRVEGRLSDGSTVDLTASSRGTTYVSDHPAVATVDPEGVVRALTPGSTTVTAANRGVSTTSTIAVNTFIPQALGVVLIPGFANNVDVQGGFAYVAAGSAGLVIVDVANPSSPLIRGSLNTPGNANDVAVTGNLAYVADGSAGLQIIDISDSARPRTVAAVDTPGEASDVVVKGNIAYVADGTTGLYLVDLADPLTAHIIGSVDTPGRTFGVDVHELRKLAVVADGSSVQVIDVRDPSTPAIVGSVPISGSSGFGSPPAVDVAVSGVFAFVAAGTSGIRIVDVRDPANPIAIGSTNEFIDAQDVAVLGNLAFAAEDVFVNAVPIFDLRNLTTPPFVGALDFSRSPSFRDDNGTGIAVTRDLVFLTGARGTIGQNGATGDTALHIGRYTQFNDNGMTPPTVRILSPADGSSVVEGQSVDVKVEASDDVVVAAVELLLDGTVIRTLTAPPYQISITIPLNVTQLTLGARAVDLAGNVGLAGPVALTVVEDTPPVISILSPLAGVTVLEGQALTVTAEATDNVGVNHVVFNVGGAMQTVTAAPYTAVFGVPLGVDVLTIQATAVDTLGQATSALRVVNVIPDPPPSVTITSPGEGALVVEDSEIMIEADASDNVRVRSVLFKVNGTALPINRFAPFSVRFTVPQEVMSLVIEAEATDNLGQKTLSLPRAVGILSDPQTTVVGQVVNEEHQPLEGASLTVFLQFASISDVGGHFTIAGMPTSRGNIVVAAAAELNGVRFTGQSEARVPIIGGITDVGSIVVRGAKFEDNLGVPLPLTFFSGDVVQLPLPFPVPFFDTEHTEAFVYLNGSVTLGAGNPFLSNLFQDFLGPLPRIAPFFSDRLFRSGVDPSSAVFVNDQLPGKFVVTWNRLIGSVGGTLSSIPITFQTILFPDGRIQFGYRAMNRGVFGRTGVSPGIALPLQPPLRLSDVLKQVDYSKDTPFHSGRQVAVFQDFGQFTFIQERLFFDLVDGFLLFLPEGGSYRVEFIAPPPTTVVGRVINPEANPVSGASVSCQQISGTFAATTGLDGTFSIPGVPSHQGDIRCLVTVVTAEGQTFTRSSKAITPVAGGTTSLGDLVIGPRRDFVLAFQEHFGNTFFSSSAQLIVLSDTPTSFTVDVPALGVHVEGNAAPGNPGIVALPASLEIQSSQFVDSRGIQVSADEEVSVLFFHTVSNTNDIYLGIPTELLGTEYVVVGFQESLSARGFSPFDWPSEFVVIANQDDTNVSIVPSCPGVIFPPRPLGVPFTVHLNRGQVYQYQCGNQRDVTGSLVTSDKPVGVVAGNACADVPLGVAFCDILSEMLMPVSSYGTEFFTAPLPGAAPDLFRIAAAQDNTMVLIDDGAAVSTVFLNRGQFSELRIEPATRITGDKPITVVQYAVGINQAGRGDPFEMQILPTTSFKDTYRLFTPSGFFQGTFAVIVASNTAVPTVTVNGLPVAGFAPLPGGTRQFVVTPVPVGESVVSASEPIGVYSIGFKSFGSYGYPAGF